jgi:hypothetical protein
MTCLLIDHVFGIDPDCEFACSKCGNIFVDSNRVNINNKERNQSEIKKNLILNYGKFWKFEWSKLIATRHLVRSAKWDYKALNGSRLKLQYDKIYTLSDFDVPISIFLQNNER